MACSACYYTCEETILADTLQRSEAEFEGVERGCELVRLLENCTGIESVAYVTNMTRRGLWLLFFWKIWLFCDKILTIL